jgi:hypothetical protein
MYDLQGPFLSMHAWTIQDIHISMYVLFQDIQCMPEPTDTQLYIYYVFLHIQAYLL